MLCCRQSGEGPGSRVRKKLEQDVRSPKVAGTPALSALATRVNPDLIFRGRLTGRGSNIQHSRRSLSFFSLSRSR